jgi:hypothetical protein
MPDAGGTSIASYAFSSSSGFDLDQISHVDIESDLKSLGVDTDYLKSLNDGFVCEAKAPAQCLSRLRATGKLGKIASYVQMQDTTFVLKFVSALEYSWRDAKGRCSKLVKSIYRYAAFGIYKTIQLRSRGWKLSNYHDQIPTIQTRYLGVQNSSGLSNDSRTWPNRPSDYSC